MMARQEHEPLPKRRRSYTVAQKISYLRDLEAALLDGTVRSMREFASHYHISVRTIEKWNLQELEETAEDGRSNSRHVKAKGVGLWPAVEERLLIWFRGVRDQRLAVSIQDIKERAASIFEDWWNALPQDERQGLIQSRPVFHEFHASDGWVHNFMDRKKVSFRKVNKNTTTLPADAAIRVQQFRDNVTDTIQRLEIVLQFLFNMDQTFALFEQRPSYTANVKGANSIDVRTSRSNTKLGCTVTLTITATGGKLPAHITFPRKGFVRQLRALENQVLPENVVVTNSVTGWVKEETAEHWFETVLEPYVTAEAAEHFLLLVDRYRVHRTEAFGMRVMNLAGILDFIPAGCTSLVQPLDLTVMKSLKNEMRKGWRRWKKDHTDNEGQCPRIELLDVVRIISEAWESVPVAVVVSGFEKAFRAAPIDAGPLPLLDEEEGLDFIDADRDEIDIIE